jgi:hypothetical protein
MRRKYEVVTYDIWGNARDGFYVNAAYLSGRFVEVDEGDSDYTINRRLRIRGVKWSGEPEFGLYGELKRNGCPALELRPVENDR